MERSITCDSCSDSAVTYDTSITAVSDLEGRICHCESCTILGRVSLDDESGRLRFILLNGEEMGNVDFPVMVDAYEASQKRIEELYEEVSKLRMQLMTEKY